MWQKSLFFSFSSLAMNDLFLPLKKTVGGGGGVVRWKSNYLFPHLAANMCKSLLAIEALGLNTAVSEHLQNLGIF